MQKHPLRNSIKPFLSYLCLFQPWSWAGTSPCTERRSCRQHQRSKSRHGRRCEDPCRSGRWVLTSGGCGWATLPSGLSQSCSSPCSGRPNGWHLQWKTPQSNYRQETQCEAELPSPLLTPFSAICCYSKYLEHPEGENRKKEKNASVVHKDWLSCGKIDFGSTHHPGVANKAPLSGVKESKLA